MKSIRDFDVQVTPQALGISAQNERGALMSLRLDPAGQIVFESEDFLEPYTVTVILADHLFGVVMRGIETGEDHAVRDRLSDYEMIWVRNGQEALTDLQPSIDRNRLN